MDSPYSTPLFTIPCTLNVCISNVSSCSWDLNQNVAVLNQTSLECCEDNHSHILVFLSFKDAQTGNVKARSCKRAREWEVVFVDLQLVSCQWVRSTTIAPSWVTNELRTDFEEKYGIALMAIDCDWLDYRLRLCTLGLASLPIS